MLYRRICHIPISWSLLFEEYMRIGEVLLLQPERVLSFDLIRLERLLSGDTELGNVMVRTQTGYVPAHETS